MAGNDNESAAEFADRIDRITVEQLREAGSLKWTLYPDALGAWVAEMDFGVADAIQRSMAEVVRRGLFGYPPLWLIAELRNATADYCGQHYGWSIDPHEVVALPDVLTGFGVAIDQFSRPGSPVIVPTPCYMPFMEIPGAHGRDLIEVPMVRDSDGWVMDEARLDAAFVAGGNLLVMCNPHNPIGKVYARPELERICAIVDRHGGRVFADEIHAQLLFDDLVHVPYASINETAAEHSVTAVAASKAWNLAGLKCAQLVLTNEVDRRSLHDSGAEIALLGSTPGLAASVAAYREGGPWLSNVMAYLDGNRRVLMEELQHRLPDAGIVAPQGTYLAWIDCRNLPIEGNPQHHFLRQAQVAVTDGSLCGEVGQGFVRLNFATSRPILRDMLDRLVGAVRAG
jgi:cystathionine beta-lyase